ncbi:5-formyltetrahydrofolate cyclo-ligase [Magnetococcales bacterium HHB-1]
MSHSKNTLRQLLLRRRDQLSSSACFSRSLDICHHIQHTKVYHSATTVSAYYPMRREADLRPLFFRSNTKKTFFLPVMQQQRLKFAEVGCATRFKRARFGVWEPRYEKLVSAETLDLILMPLLAIDGSGGRLGYGGGFYDRTLSFVMQTKKAERPSLFGVGFSFQKIDTVPCEVQDIPLDGWISEQGETLF